METTPDKHYTWKVDVDYLEEALGQIHRHGSTVITVTPYELVSSSLSPSERYSVISYLIIYYNPPITAIPGMPGSGDPATIQ